jgi:hypothetical protein
MGTCGAEGKWQHSACGQVWALPSSLPLPQGKKAEQDWLVEDLVGLPSLCCGVTVLGLSLLPVPAWVWGQRPSASPVQRPLTASSWKCMEGGAPAREVRDDGGLEGGRETRSGRI